MRRNKRSEYRQCYNAQAVVDAQGSQLVVGSRVSTCASDRSELVADVDSARYGHVRADACRAVTDHVPMPAAR